MLRALLPALLLAALALGGCVPAHGTARRSVAPALMDLSADALQRRLRAAQEGEVTLVNVWALWCEPCREELPDILRARHELGREGLRLVLISADFEASVADARAFLSTVGVDFPTWRKPSGGDTAWIDALDPGWSGALPASFLFDADGRLLRSWERTVTYEELTTAARRALRGQPLDTNKETSWRR